MNPYAPLLPAMAILCLASMLSYQTAARERTWFLPLIAAMGALNCLLWGLSAKWSRSPEQLFFIGCVWDVLTLTAYTLLPFAAGYVELTGRQISGVALMVVGVGLVKWG